jgi:hypothetical protein
MYKVHIKKWNLRKNVREREVQAMISLKNRRHAQGKASVFEVLDPNIKIHQILNYASGSDLVIRRPPTGANDADWSSGTPGADGAGPSRSSRAHNKADSAVLPSYIVVRTPSPEPLLPLVLRGPGRLGSAEQALHCIGNYVSSMFMTGAWTEDKGINSIRSTKVSDLLAGKWIWFPIRAGLELLRQPATETLGYRLLNLGCASVKADIPAEYPMMLPGFLHALEGTRFLDPRLGARLRAHLWDYVGHLCGTLMPGSLLNTAWKPIRDALLVVEDGNNQYFNLGKELRDGISTLVRFQSQKMRSCSGDVTRESVELESICIDLSDHGGRLDASARTLFQSRLQQSLAISAREGHAPHERAMVENELRLQLAAICANEGDFEGARQLLAEWRRADIDGQDELGSQGADAARHLISRYYMQCCLGILMGDMAHAEESLAPILVLRRQVDYRSTALFVLIMMMREYDEMKDTAKFNGMKREIEDIIREAEAKVGTKLTQ